MQVCNDSLASTTCHFPDGRAEAAKVRGGDCDHAVVMLRTCLIVFLALPSLSLWPMRRRPGMMEAMEGNDGAWAFKFRLPLHNWPPAGCASRR